MKSADYSSPALLWHEGEGGKVVCDLCAHRCSILPGKAGVCGVRINENGELRTLVRNRLIAANSDPIEKKPLFHFLPGSVAFSVATVGCNFHCRFCQNWNISQYLRHNVGIPGTSTSPEEVVRDAKSAGASSIAYTYTEPVIFFETAKDIGELARDEGLKNVFVTNGYLTREAVREAATFLDGANVDLKTFSDRNYRKTCGASLNGVLEGIEALLDAGVWVEITTLIVPTFNDSEEELKAIAGYIASLSPSIPWHVSRFHPDYEMTELEPTPLATLERALTVGKEAGLNHVYLGNIAGHDSENTRCPKCERIVIGRRGFRLTLLELDEGRCPACGTPIEGVF